MSTTSNINIGDEFEVSSDSLNFIVQKVIYVTLEDSNEVKRSLGSNSYHHSLKAVIDKIIDLGGKRHLGNLIMFNQFVDNVKKDMYKLAELKRDEE